MNTPVDTMPPPPPTGGSFVSKQLVMIVYALYFASFILGFTSIVGLIIAYLKRGEADPIGQTHFTFLIRTFWIGCLYFLIGIITIFIFIGWIITIAALVWMIVRLVKGILAANDGKPVANPQTWLW